MTDIRMKLLEIVGASVSDTMPKDRIGAIEEHQADTDATLDDVILMMADLIGGSEE